MDSTQASGIGLDPQLRRHDYVSPGLALVMPDAAFPDMIVGNTAAITWPHLRRWVEHNWYCDRMDPEIGFASRDEASILYNSALLFRGQPSLEIGCWRGWSAVHVALGTGTLDVIDPLLDDPPVAAKVRASFEAAGVLDRIALHPGFSPEAVNELARATGKRWAFAFIDGNHDGDAPRRDAEAFMLHAADTALVLFHDLTSPDVAAGLTAMRDAGWRTMLYQTMQIMGVAWRGDVEPVRHQPDPTVFWTLPRHLRSYEVSGWTPPSAKLSAIWWDGMTLEDRRNVAVHRAQEAQDDLLEARSDLLSERAKLAAMEERVRDAQADTIGVRALLNAESDRVKAQAAAAERLRGEREAVLERAVAAESALARMTAQIGALTTRIVEADRHASQALRKQVETAESKIDVLLATRAAQEARVQALRSAYATVIDLNERRATEDAALLALARSMAGRRPLVGLLRRSGGERIAIIRAEARSLGVDRLITDAVLAALLGRRALLGLLRRSQSSAEALIARVLIRSAQERRRAAVEETAAAARS